MSELVHRLKDWMEAWAHTPYGGWALFVIALVESSIFPIPPDVLLIALCVANPENAMFYAAVCTVGSVLGAFGGYGIGFGFMETIGRRIIRFYKAEKYFEIVERKYKSNAFFAIIMAGFTPIPYKVFTVAAGACAVPVRVMTIASFIGRGGRFFLVGGLIYLYGPQIKTFIDNNLNLLSVAFFVLLILGFVAVKFLAGRKGPEESPSAPEADRKQAS